MTKPLLVIGRHPKCDIALKYPTISAKHCELEFKDGFWFVRDLGSRNGIRVDGEKCDSCWLMPRNILAISVHRYRVAYSPKGKAPPEEGEPRSFARSLLEKAGLVRRKPTEPPTKAGPAAGGQPPPWQSDDDHDDDSPKRWTIE